MSGFVYLVGAGPGDPELLTLKAVKALRRADVVLHDNLVGEGVLAYVRCSGGPARNARRCATPGSTSRS